MRLHYICHLKKCICVFCYIIKTFHFISLYRHDMHHLFHKSQIMLDSVDLFLCFRDNASAPELCTAFGH